MSTEGIPTPKYEPLGERCWKACLLEVEPPTHDTYPFAIWDRCKLLQDSHDCANQKLQAIRELVENKWSLESTQKLHEILNS